MTKGSNNEFPSLLVVEQASAPASPAAGDQRIYMKTDHKLYHKDSGGTETEIGASSGAPVNGWNAGTGTWSYSSADSPTFVISVNNDQTSIIGVGMKLMLTQTTVKYFKVTAVGAYSGGVTLITVYGGTDFTLANEAITSLYWSNVCAPFGFPVDITKWTVRITNTSDITKAGPSANTWYNQGSLSISLPIGLWKVRYSALIQGYVASPGQSEVHMTLSTANNSASDADFVSSTNAQNAIVSTATFFRQKILSIANKTDYYLNILSVGSITQIDILGNVGTTIIEAECVY